MLNFLDPDKTTPTGVSSCRLVAVLASILRILAISVLVRYSIISPTSFVSSANSEQFREGVNEANRSTLRLPVDHGTDNAGL